MSDPQVRAVEAHLRTGRCGLDDPHDRALANLVAVISELEFEIQRHHADFEKWEAMAERGAQKIEENEQLRQKVERLESEMSWAAGHDRAGLDHLEEMMQASTERDAAEAIVRELRKHITNSQDTLQMVLDELGTEQKTEIINAIGKKRKAMRENDEDNDD